MPAEFKFNFGKNKYILREAFKDILTKSINDDFRKQGLKIAKYKENNEDIKLMEEEFNQKKFKEESIWDGKKILSDFNSLKSKNDQPTKNKIWRIFCLYSLKKGFENIKKESSQKNLKKQLGFNLLNK